MTNYLYNIDFLRFIFILIIMYGHTLGFLQEKCNPELISSLLGQSSVASYVGIASFFILSGYFLYNSYLKHQETQTKDYFIRRVLRLWPMLLVSGVVLIIAGKFNRMDMLGLFFINAGTGLVNKGLYNGASWFICVLLFVSTFYYFIITSCKEKYVLFICSLFSFWGYASISSSIEESKMAVSLIEGSNWLTLGMVLGLSNIALGIIIAILIKNYKSIDIKLKTPVKLLITIGEISLFGFILSHILFNKHPIMILPYWEFLFIILFLLFIFKMGYFSKILNCKFSKILGGCTYSMYILHLPVLYFLNKYIFKTTQNASWKLIVLYLFICTVIGILAHIFIERKINKLIDKKYFKKENHG
ncbi:MAG: acyltransferase [Candidatus Gastranaerophilales bacterium]|nr:acyltransferase [Candidatus Gastranaerophilales bacterium]